MSKKNREKKAPIQVQHKVIAEIDYDKLAEAIEKATQKHNTQHSASSEWMKFLIAPILWSVVIIAGLLAIGFWVYGAQVFVTQIAILTFNTDWWQIFAGCAMIMIGLFLIAFCAFTAATAKEIDRENDRDYVSSMFSNIVALVALVVSLIALVKG